jgi:Domain of unknown function (DUF4326)
MGAMTVDVVNKRSYSPSSHDYYIGRPSPLGNPFTHKNDTLADHIVPTREIAIASYEKWLRSRIAAGDREVIAAMRALHEDSVLVCWCAPALCHGTIIEKVWYSIDWLTVPDS